MRLSSKAFFDNTFFGVGPDKDRVRIFARGTVMQLYPYGVIGLVWWLIR